MTDHAPGQPGPDLSAEPGADPHRVSALDRPFDALRSLGVHRRSDDKWIGGVCSGVADRLGIDPVIVRAGLVLLGLLGGFGATLYLLAWVLLPDDHGQIAAQRAIRDGDTSSIILLVVAAAVLVSGFAWWSGGGLFGWRFPWPIVVVAALAWWFWSSRDRHRAPPGQPAVLSPAAPAASAATAAPTAAMTRGVPFTREGTVMARAPRRRSGGLLLAVMTVGLALITFGVLQWVGAAHGLTGNDDAIAMAGALAAFGLVLLAAGLLGWRAGLVGFLAILTALATVASSASADSFRPGSRVGDASWSPQAVTADASYRLLAGDAVLDLTDLPADGPAQATLPVFVGAGQLQIMVPSDLTVHVKAHVSAGEITVPGGSAVTANDGGQDRTVSGLNVARDVVVGEGPTDVVVEAGVGAGQIRISKEQP